MLKKPYRRLIILLMTGLLAYPWAQAAQAALTYDSSLHWQTLGTQHFNIHYPLALQDQAVNLAAIAETVHAQLIQKMQWEPRARTEVVLTDEFDFANGMADAIPYNQVVIYLTPPAIFPDLQDYAEWLETVFTHEYTHVLHLDKAIGAPHNLRSLLGRFALLFPNRMQPAWFIEGIATYHETDDARGIGRGQASYYNMIMRMEVKNGLRPLRQINQAMDTWPSGIVPYLYGVHFYRFIAASRGPEAINRFIDGYSDNLLPFMINTNARTSLGGELPELWQPYNDYLRKQFQPALDAVRQQGIVAGQPVNKHPYHRALVKSDGRDLYVLEEDGASSARISRYGTKTTLRVNNESHFDVHPEAGILLAQPDLVKNSRVYFDLYRVDPATLKKRRITHGERFIFGCWRYDAQAIIAVQTLQGRSRLVQLTPDGHLDALLWEGDYGDVLGALSCSPSEAQAATTRFRPGRGWGLELFDLTKKEFQVLTEARGIEEDPVFSPGGNAVYFSADYDGIYNIYRIHLSDGAISRLTRVESGAFSPAWHQNALFYTFYTGNGFDVYRHDSPAALPQDAATDKPRAYETVGANAWAATEHAVTPYRGWTKLAPQWWLPYFIVSDIQNEYGLTTGGNDPLLHHQYSLSAGYDLENEVGTLNLNYINDSTPLTFLFNTNRNHVLSDDNSTVVGIRRTVETQVSALLPILSVNRSWSLQAAAIDYAEKDILNMAPRVAKPAFDDGLLGIGVNFDSTHYYPLSISQSDGRAILLTYESHDVLPSDFRGNSIAFNWREFLPLGNEQVLALQLQTARATRFARYYQLGGADTAPDSGVLAGLTIDERFNRHRFALRGYDEDLLELFGNRMLSASAEWRWLIKRVERGWMAPPLALQNISATFFVDSGDAWFPSESMHALTGIGAELNMDSRLFYALPIYLRLGYASGLDRLGEDQVYLKFGSSF